MARSVAQSPTAPTAPTRSTGHARVPRGSMAAPVRLERRGRSVCPRCSRERRLFRHCGVKQESPGNAEKAPGTFAKFYSRTGPIGSRRLDASAMGLRPVIHARAGLEERAVAVYVAVAAVKRPAAAEARADGVRCWAWAEVCLAGWRARAGWRWRWGFSESQGCAS